MNNSTAEQTLLDFAMQINQSSLFFSISVNKYEFMEQDWIY